MKLKIMLGTFAASLFAAPSALAVVGSAQQVYGGTAGVQQQKVAETAAASSSNLPFTGLDLVLLGVGGALLVLIGVVLTLLARPHASA
jgi:hypothetical protein